MLDFLAEYGLLGLFIGSFLAATVVPFSADVLLVGMLVADVNSAVALLVVATLGNWIGGITSYGIGRAGKWEWIERLHDKHTQKREERKAQKQAQTEDADKSAEVVEEEALPQAAAKQPSHSAILFDEGQRRYAPSQVRATEDPSMSTPHALSNEKAYADDAKAFGRY